MKEAKIFAKAISESDPELRDKLVADLCGSDVELLRRVRNLISAHEQPDTFFADPVHAQSHRHLEETSKIEETLLNPRQVGPYRILQEIGEGGMGLVFMAEQTKPVRRRVALKIIKPGMDSRNVIARFEAERQALAMMDHPNIAKVFDAGTTDDGRPYFVMELVNGIPITNYCDQEKLATDKRIRLFMSVCRAVQHAHQKGIIHRDIKPGNILVAEFDGEPVAKVIDFGIAKATGSSLTEKTLFTEFGQVVGTIEYMSPEQARRNQRDIDTRSDVYSLGVVLYKLLTGETPFGSERFKQVAWDEILKIILEESPELPSIKIGSSDSLEQIAIQRNISATKLSSQIQGDLDWIVTKSLEKNRDHRYQTASDLADDLNRHLKQLPIMAAPSSSIDRLRKFARRNPNRFWSIVATIASLCFVFYIVRQASNRLDASNTKMAEAVQAARITLEQAEQAVIGDDSYWSSAKARTDHVKDLLDNDEFLSREIRRSAELFLDEFEFKKSERTIAQQIEEVVIEGASDPSLASWQAMEVNIRRFFLDYGFDLDNEEPAKIGNRIYKHRSATMWADLLELWIGTRGQLAAIGGPKLNASMMQPWAEAMYIADKDPVRTGIRRFIYTPPPNRQNLDDFMDGVNLESLSPRTLAWLGTCYFMVGDPEYCDHILQLGLKLYPRDVMLTHDYGYVLFHQKRYQQAARMFHRCLVLRDDVPGLWISLARTLDALDEKKAAKRARQRAAEISEKKIDGHIID